MQIRIYCLYMKLKLDSLKTVFFEEKYVNRGEDDRYLSIKKVAESHDIICDKG